MPDTTPDADLRQRVALVIGAHRNGPASDGLGWFRDEDDKRECYALADALLPLMATERTADAHPPAHRWRVEHVDGDEWVPASGLKAEREEALTQLRAGERHRPLWADGTPVRRRLVRETTICVVEDPEEPRP